MKLSKLEIFKDDEEYLLRFYGNKKEVNIQVSSNELAHFLFTNILNTQAKLELKALLSDHILQPKDNVKSLYDHHLYDENYTGEF